MRPVDRLLLRAVATIIRRTVLRQYDSYEDVDLLRDIEAALATPSTANDIHDQCTSPREDLATGEETRCFLEAGHPNRCKFEAE